MASLEHHDQALLECILSELKLKGLNGLNFSPKKTATTKKTAGPAGHIEHLLTPGVSTPETWSETPSPSASTMSTQSTSVESSPLLRPKQLCLDADARLFRSFWGVFVFFFQGIDSLLVFTWSNCRLID